MKFNNLIKYSLVIASGIVLTSCLGINNNGNSTKTENKDSSSTITETKEDDTNVSIFNLVTKFDIKNSYGFDYSLTQKEISSGIVSNSKMIEVRLSDNLGVITEKLKSLNKDITNGQYSETTSTYYYKDSKIGYYNDSNVIDWKDSTLDEFVSVNINDFDFSNYYTSNSVQLGTYGKYSQLTLNIPSTESNSFLGVKETIKDLSFVIICTKTYDTLISFNMSYNSDLTSLEYEFKPYLSKTNINIPE